MLIRALKRCGSHWSGTCVIKRLRIPPNSGTNIKCFFSFESNPNAGQEDDKKDHLTRTKASFRQHEMLPGTVTEITDMSPDVRGIKLHISKNQSCKFKAGQWIDLLIPGLSTVGGFSICSSPSDFDRDSTIELAVKYSSHPPANWIHRECEVGISVSVRFGGDFYYDPLCGDRENLLLVAGGVGVNPIYSILRHRRDLLHQDNPVIQGATTVLYSAKNLNELIFQREIHSICESIPNGHSQFFLTQEDSTMDYTSIYNLLHGRITQQSIEEVLQTFNNPPVSYICGPPGFIDEMEKHLENLGLPQINIRHEKWW